MPSNSAVWISLYFGTGLTLGLAIKAFNHSKDMGHFFANPFFDSQESPLFLTVVLALAVLLWPVLIIYGLFSSEKAGECWNRLIDHSEYLSTKRTIKSCKLIGAYIHNITTVEAAEQVERPTDRLNRTPDAPFGHLNPGWKVFLLKRQNGYKLWTYEMPGLAPDQTGIDPPEPGMCHGRQLGYAWVSRQGIEAEFLYEWN